MLKAETARATPTPTLPLDTADGEGAGGGRIMIIDATQPYWFHRADCLHITEVADAMHMDTRAARELLDREGVTIYRFVQSWRTRYLIPEVEALHWIRVHGSEWARKQRMRRWR